MVCFATGFRPKGRMRNYGTLASQAVARITPDPCRFCYLETGHRATVNSFMLRGYNVTLAEIAVDYQESD